MNRTATPFYHFNKKFTNDMCITYCVINGYRVLPLQDAVEVEDYDQAKLFKSNILDLRKEVEELISGQEIASLVASVLPTPEWEGESNHMLTNDGDPAETSFDDEIVPGKINAAGRTSPTNVVESPATISPPGDEVTTVGHSSRSNKSHVDYESRVSIYIYIYIY